MPTIGAKVTQEELDAVVECANRRGVTISNLIKTAILREVSQIKMPEPENEVIHNRTETIQMKMPQKNLLDLLVESASQRRMQNQPQ